MLGKSSKNSLPNGGLVVIYQLYNVQSVKNPNPDPSSQWRDFEDLSYRPKHTLPFLGVQPGILRGYIDSLYPNTQCMVYHEPFNLIETNFTPREKSKLSSCPCTNIQVEGNFLCPFWLVFFV